MTIPNRGSAGAVLDATNNGLTQVEGGAVWMDTGIHTPTVTDSPTPNGFQATAKITLYEPVPATEMWVVNQWVESENERWSLSVYQTTDIRLKVGTTTISTGISSPWVDGDAVYGEPVWIRGIVDTVAGDFDMLYSLDGVTFVSLYSGTGEVWPYGTDVPPSKCSINHNCFRNEAPGVGAVSNWVLHSCEVAADDVSAPFYVFNAATDISDPAATTIVATSGQTITVNRSAAGPVTTFVPEGTVAYVNPDDTDTANRVTIPANAVFTIPPGDDFYAVWCGWLGNETSVIRYVFGHSTGSTGLMAFRLIDAVDERVYGKVGDNQIIGTTAASTLVAPVVVAVRYDASTDTGTVSTFDQAGLTDEDVEAFVSTPGGLSGVGDMNLGTGVPGVLSSFLWDKGVDVCPTDEELAALAAQMISAANRPPRPYVGALPPVGHKVRGDFWTAANGHTVRFDGAQWQPVSPATGNLAALLGNNQLLLGAS